MSYILFDKGDGPYLAWLHTHPEGLVLNTRRGKGDRFAMLHRPTCSHIASTAGMAEEGFTMREDIKVCSTALEDLVTFLKEYKTVDNGTIAPCLSCRATLEPILWQREAVVIPIRKPWTREELLILLNLYAKIPFGKFDQSNPVLVDVAKHMVRTPGSVAMKLSNLASLDERLAARGIKGLSGASALDRTVWAEFYSNHDDLAVESERLLNELMAVDTLFDVDVVPEQGIQPLPDLGSTEGTATVKVRRGQAYFRQVVLNAYGGRCAVTGLAVRELLVASHIVPWAMPDIPDDQAAHMLKRIAPAGSHKHRLDVRNGIALNALHDRAFDQGFITFDSDRRMVCGPALRKRFAEEEIARQFKAYEGKPLRVPAESEGPGADYLEWHQEWRFRTVN